MAKNGVELIDWARNNGGDHVQDVGGPSMARQEFAAECDINEIMARYETTGALPANNREPRYVDFTAVPGDLMGTLAVMDKAQEAFMTLPAKVRREFDNSPHAFVDFASNRANLPWLQEHGLAPKPPVPELFPVPPATPPAAPAAAPPAPHTVPS